uniref:Secreted protein n=1 Tax=Zea mays TaxID=4577 RepID=C0PEV2_MAIZE|nr:unknown [Zea mays]
MLMMSHSHCILCFLSLSSSFTICQCSKERLFSPKLEAIICAIVSHLLSSEQPKLLSSRMALTISS